MPTRGSSVCALRELALFPHMTRPPERAGPGLEVRCVRAETGLDRGTWVLGAEGPFPLPAPLSQMSSQEEGPHTPRGSADGPDPGFGQGTVPRRPAAGQGALSVTTFQHLDVPATCQLAQAPAGALRSA